MRGEQAPLEDRQDPPCALEVVGAAQKRAARLRGIELTMGDAPRGTLLSAGVDWTGCSADALIGLSAAQSSEAALSRKGR